jgi:hypothetical protein
MLTNRQVSQEKVPRGIGYTAISGSLDAYRYIWNMFSRFRIYCVAYYMGVGSSRRIECVIHCADVRFVLRIRRECEARRRQQHAPSFYDVHFCDFLVFGKCRLEIR